MTSITTVVVIIEVFVQPQTELCVAVTFYELWRTPSSTAYILCTTSGRLYDVPCASDPCL